MIADRMMSVSAKVPQVFRKCSARVPQGYRKGFTFTGPQGFCKDSAKVPQGFRKGFTRPQGFCKGSARVPHWFHKGGSARVLQGFRRRTARAHHNVSAKFPHE